MTPEEDVYEIREYLNNDGQTVKSEVTNVKDAAKEIEHLNLVDRLEKAAKQAQHEQSSTPGRIHEVSQNGTKSKAVPQPISNTSVEKRMMDDHDWADIERKAKEIENGMKSTERDKVHSVREEVKGRNQLEGSGWTKGFLNQSKGGNVKQKRQMHSGGKSRPQVDEENGRAAERRVSFNVPGNIQSFQHDVIIEKEKEQKDEAGAEAPAFTGQVKEVKEVLPSHVLGRQAFERCREGCVAIDEVDEAGSCRASCGEGEIPAGMSRFKAKRLGLI